MSEGFVRGGMARDLPHSAELAKAIEAIAGGRFTEAALLQDAGPGEREQAARLLGLLAGVVEQIQLPLRGGHLHDLMNQGYVSAYQGQAWAMLGQIADRARWDQGFIAAGMREAPRAQEQLLLGTLGGSVMWRAVLAAAALNEPGQSAPEEGREKARRLTDEAAAAADKLSEAVVELRRKWELT
ncbi:hypothetical protein [Streptomyces yaizuensis]|uniref:Uncharacterized protein n=1 Tax=Streptomyces yaizuensis TaxID=2989713 RepID=A0AA86M797_9ACTN|nr:hypothetical protein [Streptomyces sp. YSPA8]BDT39491.1 hypothetical protein SYYSPA8_36865 [Streptomyces sp. YSPA8]